MNDLLQRELEEICLRILRNSGENTEELLSDTRALYEKIVVLNHQINKISKSSVMSEHVETLEAMDTLSAREVPIPQGPPTGKKARDIEISTKPTPEESPIQTNTPVANKKVDAKSKITNTAPPPHKKEPIHTEPQKTEPAAPAGVSSVKVGLNDRIAFVKKLFHNQDDDFNRVLSQINGFQSFEEAEAFLNNLVVPEYGWNMDDEFTIRFINLVRMRFGLDEIPEE